MVDYLVDKYATAIKPVYKEVVLNNKRVRINNMRRRNRKRGGK